MPISGRRFRAVFTGLVFVVAFGGGCGADPVEPVRLDTDFIPLPASVPRAAHVETNLPPCASPKVLFLNFQGGLLTGNQSCSNASQNCSYIVLGGTRNFPAFSGSAAQRDQIIGLVTQYFAPFNVQLVTVRPTVGPYEMSMIGGSPQDIGVAAGPAGLAPLDCGNQNATDISFAFSIVSQNDPLNVAVTIAQEAAHGYGLGHVNNMTDIMYPRLTGQATGFHNETMQIYDVSGPSSDCTGTGQQNDVTMLNQNVGPGCGGSGGSGGGGGGGSGGGGGGDAVPPQVAINEPANGANVQVPFTVFVTASDNSGSVVRVDLWIDGAQAQGVVAPPWSFTVTSLAAGSHTLTAKAFDPSNNVATSMPAAVTVQTGGGPGGGSGGSDPGATEGDAVRGNCAAAPGAAADRGGGLAALALLAFAGLSTRRARRAARSGPGTATGRVARR